MVNNRYHEGDVIRVTKQGSGHYHTVSKVIRTTPTRVYFRSLRGKEVYLSPRSVRILSAGPTPEDSVEEGGVDAGFESESNSNSTEGASVGGDATPVPYTPARFTFDTAQDDNPVLNGTGGSIDASVKQLATAIADEYRHNTDCMGAAVDIACLEIRRISACIVHQRGLADISPEY